MTVMTINYIDNNSDEGETNSADRRQPQRYCTDLQHFFLFGMFFTLWFAIAIHAYTAGRQFSDFTTEDTFNKVASVVSAYLTKSRNLCAAFTWLAVLLLGLYFIAIRFFTKYVIYATIVLECIVLIVLLALFVQYDRTILKPLSIVAFILGFIIYGLSIYTFAKVDCNIVSAVIQESLKAVKCHPSSIAIVIIYSFLMASVGYFTFSVIFGLLTIPKVRISLSNVVSYRDEMQSSGMAYDSYGYIDDPPNYVYFLIFAFASCSLWIFTLIYNVMRTTLYGIFSNWYRTEDKTRIPRTISFRITYITLRYHMGTLTFGSTIFTIIQIIRTIYNSWIDLYGKFRTKKITIFCFLIVLANATSNTFVVCMIYGTGYYRSMRDSFKLLMQNPLKFAAIRFVTELMIIFGALLIPGLTTLFAHLYIRNYYDYYDYPTDIIAVGIVALISFSITAVALETFYAATTAVLFCFLEDLSLKQNENDYEDEINIVTDGV